MSTTLSSADLPQAPAGALSEAATGNLVRRVLHWLIAVLVVVYCIGAFTTSFDADETQSIVTSHYIAQGEQLYTQIWDNHGPLLSYLLAGYLRLVEPSDHSIYFHARFLMLVLQLATAVLFFMLAREIFGRESIAVELAVFLFLSSYIVAQKGLEIRSDNPLHLLWIASLWLWFRASRSEKLLDFFLAGLVLGAGFTLSFKTLTLGASVGLMFIFEMLLRRRLRVLPVLAFGIGSTVVPLIMVAMLMGLGNFKAFWASFVGQNMDREAEPAMEAWSDLVKADRIWVRLMMAALIYVPYAATRKRAPQNALIMWPCAAMMILQYIYLLPTHHFQSFLPVVGPGAIIIAWALIDFFALVDLNRFETTKKIGTEKLASFALIFLLVYQIREYGFHEIESSSELARYDQYLHEIEPGVMVMDGYGVPLNRPHPFYIKSFVETLSERFQAGKLDLDVVGGLDAKDVRYLIYDRRVADLGQAFRMWVQDNYLPLKAPLMMAAGKWFALGDPRAREAKIQIAGAYYWKIGEASEGLTVNGEKAENPVQLKDGTYALEWTGDQPLVLCTATSERWGDWRVMTPDHVLPKQKKYRENIRSFWPNAEP